MVQDYIDTDKMYSYIREWRNDLSFTPENEPEYIELREFLQNVCDSHDLTFIYIVESGKYARVANGELNTKASKEAGYGYYDVLIESVGQEYLDKGFIPWTFGMQNAAKTEYARLYKKVYEKESDVEFLPRPYSKDDTGGPHTSVILPLKSSSDGEVKLVLVAQIAMDVMSPGRTIYLIKAAIATMVLLLATTIAVSLLFRRQIVAPVQIITKEAKRFTVENSRTDDGIASKLSTNINELRNLAQAIDTMETENLNYVKSLTTMTAEKEKIGTELHIAELIQKDSLPSVFPPFPDRNEFDIFASMTPAKEVGGDFYDFYFIDDDHLALVIADVSGKGIPAALYMMISKVLISDRALMGGKPSEILSFVNSRICEKNDAEMFVTVWIGILEISSGRLVSSNAGHEDPIIYRKGEGFSFRKEKHGLVVGAMNGIEYCDHEYVLKPGDKIFLYTDGTTEATNSKNELFGSGRLLESVDSSSYDSPDLIIEKVRADIDNFVGDAPQFDDLTMLCLELKEKDSSVEASFDAKLEKLPDAIAFVDSFLEERDCSMRIQMQMDLSIEELFVNVANYAYPEGEGKVSFRLSEEGRKITIEMSDEGVPFDPLKKPDPDITLSADERPVGGLGVFIVKKHMDSVVYKYENGRNILTMTKTLG